MNIHTTPQPTAKIVDLFNFSQNIKTTIKHFPLQHLPLLQNDESDIYSIQRDIFRHQFDSLIIATKYDLISAFNLLFQYLALSRPFVIFSQFIQPLTELYQTLLQEHTGINLDLTETWTREYQVLPARTHPLMKMSNASGFLLSGIKVAVSQPVQLNKKQKIERNEDKSEV